MRIYPASSKFINRARGRIFEYCTDLTHWAFFVVMLSLTPLFIGVVRKLRSGDVNFKDAVISVIERGELLLICVVLLGTTIGELVRLNSDYVLVKILVGGASLILLILCVSGYTSAAYDPKPIIEIIAEESFSGFGLTIAVCLAFFLIPKRQ